MSEKTDHDLLIELNIKMDVLQSSLVSHLAESVKLHAALEGRLALLEQWRWKWVGAIALLAFLLSFVSQTLLKFWIK